jgi:hypothetical protein
MEPWQQRVVDEQTALADRLVKLENFIGTLLFNSLTEADQKLLLAQKEAMTVYWDILSARIASWPQTTT